MFPTEVEMQVRRQQLEQEAENHRLVNMLREDSDQPTLLQRVRERLSTSETPPRREKNIKRARVHG